MEILDYCVSEPSEKAKLVVIIVHGMQEHLYRYTDFANYLANKGYIAVRYSLLGHGPSVSKEEKGYFGEKNGDQKLVQQLNEVVKETKRRYPNQAIVLYAHSLGSMIARAYLQDQDSEVDGVILQGPACFNQASFFGMTVSKILQMNKGPKGKSKLLDKLVAGSFQAHQKPGESWVCNNQAFLEEARKDPLIIPLWTLQAYYDLFELNIRMSQVEEYRCQKPELPILLLAGEQDPVIGGLVGLKDTIHRLKLAGYEHVESAMFAQMKHDLLHEIPVQKVYDRVEVFLDSIANASSNFLKMKRFR